MPLHTIAILSPGEMGHAIGLSLVNQGFEVITCLKGRSERTRQLSNRGKIKDVNDLNILVAKADIVLSILVPSKALEIAKQVSSAVRETGNPTVFVDCNAVSPETTKQIELIIGGTGSKFMDASIIGSPPGSGTPPRLYVSGKETDLMKQLNGPNITVVSLGEAIGRASGIKMCYAALTKGTSALHFALLTAAEAMGLSEELKQELMFSQSKTYERMERQLPAIPVKAGRWVGEMKEIASTFEQVGVTGKFHLGAAEIFDLLNKTPFGKEAPEDLDKERTLSETVSTLTELLIPDPD